MSSKIKKYIKIMILFVLPFQVYSEEENKGIVELTPADTSVSALDVSDSENKEIEDNKGIKEFSAPSISGFGMGAGIGANILDSKEISSAIIVNNVVRVTSTNSIKNQFWLEAHYNFGKEYITYECNAFNCLVQDIEENKRKKINKGDTFFKARRVFHGPFFAVNVSDSNSIINGVALGYMLSLRKVGSNESPTDNYFNIGIGLSTTRIQSLANGLSDGDVVEAGTQIEYRTDDETGILILFSVGI